MSARLCLALGLTLAVIGWSGPGVAYAPEGVIIVEEIEETEDDPFAPLQDGKSALPATIPAAAPDDTEAMDGEYGRDELLMEDDPHILPEEGATVVPHEGRAALSDVRFGEEGLPEEVRATRTLLLNAARSGDIEALGKVFSRHKPMPIVGYDSTDNPVEALRQQSGDEAGQEILAILIEVLETGHVPIGPDGGETFVWPYFAEVPLADLKPKHYVDLYMILTSIDVEEIERLGRYTFFRVGISADGRLRYFLAGDEP